MQRARSSAAEWPRSRAGQRARGGAAEWPRGGAAQRLRARAARGLRGRREWAGERTRRRRAPGIWRCLHGSVVAPRLSLTTERADAARLLPVNDVWLARQGRYGAVLPGLGDPGERDSGDPPANAVRFLACNSGIVGEASGAGKGCPRCGAQASPDSVGGNTPASTRRTPAGGTMRRSPAGGQRSQVGACAARPLSRTLFLLHMLAGVAEWYTRRSQKPLLSRG